MYGIITRAYPRKGTDKYRQPKRIIVADVTNGVKGCYRYDDPTIVRQWNNVDSRPR